MFKIQFYFYITYGLIIKSSIDFPELLSTNDDINMVHDVLIRYDDSEILKQTPEKSNNLRKISNVPFFWDHEHIFSVRDGKEIIVNPNLSINNLFLRSLILGQGLAIILHQRDYLVLHGSAVKIYGDAVAFLGQCGEGKSTTTFALNDRGHALIADDVLAVKINGNNNPKIYPSFSRIKLHKDVIDNMGFKHTSTEFDPDFQKYLYKAKNNFSVDPVPLKKIYILKKDKKNDISTLSLQEKLISIIRNTYPKPIFGSNEKVQNLFQCSNIINKISVKHLCLSHSFEKLEELVDLVEKDINS